MCHLGRYGISWPERDCRPFQAATPFSTPSAKPSSVPGKGDDIFKDLRCFTTQPDRKTPKKVPIQWNTYVYRYRPMDIPFLHVSNVGEVPSAGLLVSFFKNMLTCPSQLTVPSGRPGTSSTSSCTAGGHLCAPPGRQGRSGNRHSTRRTPGGDYFARSRDEIIGGCLSFLPSRAEEVRRILQLSCVGSGAVVVVAFSGRAARGLWAPCGSTASTPNFGAYAPWERCDQCCCFVSSR